MKQRVQQTLGQTGITGLAGWPNLITVPTTGDLHGHIAPACQVIHRLSLYGSLCSKYGHVQIPRQGAITLS